FGLFKPLQLIPLRVLPVPYDSVVSAKRAMPGNLVPARRQKSPDSAAASLGSTADAGVVFVGRRSAGTCLDEQREKARQFARGARHRRHLAGFIKVLCYVCYICVLGFRRSMRPLLNTGIAVVSLRYAVQRECNLPEGAIAPMGVAHVTHDVA